MGDVVNLYVVTTLDTSTERVLTGGAAANLESAILIGWDADGDFYFSSSIADGADVLWLLELAKKRLLEMGDD